MVEIEPEKDLVRMGEGLCYSGYKIYVPKTVFDHLKLSPKEKVEYFLILDSRYRDLIVIRKVKKE